MVKNACHTLVTGSIVTTTVTFNTVLCTFQFQNTGQIIIHSHSAYKNSEIKTISQNQESKSTRSFWMDQHFKGQCRQRTMLELIPASTNILVIAGETNTKDENVSLSLPAGAGEALCYWWLSRGPCKLCAKLPPPLPWALHWQQQVLPTVPWCCPLDPGLCSRGGTLVLSRSLQVSRAALS